MTLTAYATEEELTIWLPSSTTLPDDVDRLLERASDVLDEHIRLPFDVNTSGEVTDTELAVILSDACCAQVEHWLEVGEENDLDGLAGTQISVDGYSGLRALPLAPRAKRILKINGMLEIL